MNRLTSFRSWRRMPPNLRPKILELFGRSELGPRAHPPPYLGAAIYVGRGLQGRSILVTNTPVLIQRAQFAWPYMILNPSRTTGLTTWRLLCSETVSESGNSGSVGVSNYLNMHLFLNVLSVSGQWDFYAQVYDPYSHDWADSEKVFSAVSAQGDYYHYIGELGVATDFRMRWNRLSAGSITFSISYVLKEGLSGGAEGFSQTVYIGNSEVNVDTGFPILEGQHYTFVLGEGVELWGVSEDPNGVNLKVFEL